MKKLLIAIAALGAFSTFAQDNNVDRIIFSLRNVSAAFNQGNVKQGCYLLGKMASLIELQQAQVNSNIKSELKDELRYTLIWSQGLAESGLCNDHGNPRHTHLPTQMAKFAEDSAIAIEDAAKL